MLKTDKQGRKLYPFSTWKNQHNFQLVHDVAFNRMRDMESGELEMDKKEYKRLSYLVDRCNELFMLDLPVAWLTGEELHEAREIALLGISHRAEACMEAGRPDLLKYC